MSLKKRVALGVAVLVAVALAYLLLAPVPITPGAWTPPVAPTLTGQYQQNTRLTPVQRLSLGGGHKPEDVALDADGRIYGGSEDGRIIVLQRDGTQPRVFANTGGRPLGLAFDPAGNLIVADAIKGLLSVNKSGEVKVLAVEADGVRFGCLNDLDVAADGTIYFTEASTKFPMSQFTNDLLEHQPAVRLMLQQVLRKLRHRKLVRRLSEINRAVGGNVEIVETAKRHTVSFDRKHFHLARLAYRQQ